MQPGLREPPRRRGRRRTAAAEAMRMDQGGAGDRWLIGDLRDRSQVPNVDHFLVAPETATPMRDERELELERLRRRVEELERDLRGLAGSAASATTGYTLFFPGNGGYEIAAGEGAPPALGAVLDVGGERLVVDSIRRSPFPCDDRPCLVLSPVRDPASTAA